MAKQRIHISNLNIRLPRSAAGNARTIANDIGRAVLKSVAGVAGEQRGTMNFGEIAVGGIKISDDVAGQTGTKAAAEVKRRIENGGRK